MDQSELIISLGHGNGTNPACNAEYVEADATGCERCGHTRGEHTER